MSRAAGTLVTTYNATHTAPSLMPGYGGHVPTISSQYGETFGNATKKYFNDYRSEVLNSSKSLYSRGGYFPTSISNNPELVINHRRRLQDETLFMPKYELRNYNHDRTRDLNNKYNLSQSHRMQYSDRTGELHPVKEFIIPVSNDKMNESYLPYSSMMLRHKSEVNISRQGNFIPPRGVKNVNEYKLA